MRDHAFVSVVGVTFEGRQNKLAGLLAVKADGAVLSAMLVREPTNRFDPNAIAVIVGANMMGGIGAPEQHVGFIPGPLAAKWAPKMDAGQGIEIRETRIAEDHRGKFSCKIAVHIQEERHGTEDAATT